MILKLLILATVIAGLLSAILVEERKRNIAVLDTVKPQQVPPERGWADDFRNYRQ
jgi:hypothetical protein